MTTPRHGFFELSSDTQSGYVAQNDALRILENRYQVEIQGRSTDPPAGSADGDVWYVERPSTGAWAGNDYHLAHWYNNHWYFYRPAAGTILYDRFLNTRWRVTQYGSVRLIKASPYRDRILGTANVVRYLSLSDRYVDGLFGDESGAKQHGWIQGAGTATPYSPNITKEGASLYLDPNGAYVLLPAFQNTAYTFEIWFQTYTLDRVAVLGCDPFISSEAVELNFNRIRVRGVNGSTILQENTPYHVVVTSSGNFYVNTASQGTFTPWANLGISHLGIRNDETNPYTGNLAHFAFYHRALSGAEIIANYNEGRLQ